MTKFDGLKLKPLFHSEIASSYIVHDIFSNHKDVASAFLKHFLDLNADSEGPKVHREKSYKGKGSVDLHLHFESQGIKYDVLIEVKVHDYTSVTPGQIKTYFDAASGENPNGKVYFIYMTQFNKNNFPLGTSTALAPTIKEFEDSVKALGSKKDMIKHVNWAEFHYFLSTYTAGFSGEQNMMLDLQRNWITAESKHNLAEYTFESGDRSLSDYFDDVEIILKDELPFGKDAPKKNRQNFVIDLSVCSEKQLGQVLSVIKKYAGSARVDMKTMKPTGVDTMEAAKRWLAGLAEDETCWGLLPFYASLFDFVNKTDYLELNGTGTRGFSVRVNVTGTGTGRGSTSISLCTFWVNKTIEFSLTR